MGEVVMNRNSELAKIHIAKKDLGLDDDTYRDVLWTVARVRSAKDLDHHGREQVLKHFKSKGFKCYRKWCSCKSTFNY